MIIYSDQRSILGSDKERFRKVNQWNVRKNQPPGNSKDNVAGNDTSEGRFNQVLAFGRQFLCNKNALYMVFNYLSTIEN